MLNNNEELTLKSLWIDYLIKTVPDYELHMIDITNIEIEKPIFKITEKHKANVAKLQALDNEIGRLENLKSILDRLIITKNKLIKTIDNQKNGLE